MGHRREHDRTSLQMFLLCMVRWIAAELPPKPHGKGIQVPLSRPVLSAQAICLSVEGEQGQQRDVGLRVVEVCRRGSTLLPRHSGNFPSQTGARAHIDQAACLLIDPHLAQVQVHYLHHHFSIRTCRPLLSTLGQSCMHAADSDLRTALTAALHAHAGALKSLDRLVNQVH